MKKVFAILFIFVIIIVSGCTSHWKPVCRHDTLYTASVVSEYYPVRIAGALNPNHVQAQVLFDGEWRYLEIKNGLIVIGEKNRQDFYPIRFYTFREYTKHFLRWTRQIQRRNSVLTPVASQ